MVADAAVENGHGAVIAFTSDQTAYALPEFQPMYDFEEDHFSFWAGPELGKIIAPGRILYFKPGFGVDPDADKGDRDWSFELGIRWFL